jgi:hypothetical protein
MRRKGIGLKGCDIEIPQKTEDKFVGGSFSILCLFFFTSQKSRCTVGTIYKTKKN